MADGTIGKVQVLRAYLVALQLHTTPTLNVNLPVPGGVHGTGSRLGAVRSWLLPEILLCLDRTDSKPLFFVTRTGEVVQLFGTLVELDAWLEDHRQEIVMRDVSNALKVLERSASRLPNRVDKSGAHKAIASLRRSFVKTEG